MSIADGDRFDYVIDGSNVLLNARVPSVRLFVALLFMLESNGKRYKVYFDKTVFPEVAKKDSKHGTAELPLLRRLCEVLEQRGLVSVISHADGGIQEDCRRHDAPVINGTDKNDSWTYMPPILRYRIERRRDGGVQVYLVPAGQKKKLMKFDASESFEFGGIQFPAHADIRQDAVPAVWVERPHLRKTVDYGNLLVIALDASQSMDETDTFDGRTKRQHVNEILRACIESLEKSTLKLLYISILGFSDDVIVISPPGSPALFSPLKVWLRAPVFDYAAGIPRGTTNIRLALDRATDFIDGFRQSDASEDLARRWDSSTVVLLTDGRHETEVDGVAETSADIRDHVYRTMNRSPGTSYAFVGMGGGASHTELQSWASKASPVQSVLAARNRVRLVDGALYVKADTRDSEMMDVVRSFIDVASSRGNPGGQVG